MNSELAAMRVTFSRDIPRLGERIKKARQGTEKSLTRLAADAGISVPHWHRIENEKVVELPVETLRRIEQALGISLGISNE